MPVAAQTRLYHPALAGTPPEEGNWNYLGLFQTRLYHGSAELAERLVSKSVTYVTARLLDLGRHIPVSPACSRQAGNSDLIRVSIPFAVPLFAVQTAL